MKNKHSFFYLLIVCRSCFLIYEGWGGDPKNGSPAGVISGRWSVPHIPAYPYMSDVPTYPIPQGLPIGHSAGRFLWHIPIIHYICA